MRTTTDVINDVINENKNGTWLLYLLTFLFVVVGLGVISHSAFYSANIGEGFIGVVSSSLCYPALYFARRVRQENITIRILEIPLNNAKTADDAADMLQKLMKEVFLKGGK